MNIKFENLIFIYDHTTHPGNIGMIARVCKNMGIERIRLVEPECSKEDEQAVANSAGATDTLERMEVYSTMEEALADVSLVFATSARKRALNPKIVSPSQIISSAREKLSKSNTSKKNIAVLFGTEHSGLSNDLLLHANFHVVIDANPEYTSLNLAMASLLIAYEVRKSIKEQEEVNILSCKEGIEKKAGSNSSDSLKSKENSEGSSSQKDKDHSKSLKTLKEKEKPSSKKDTKNSLVTQGELNDFLERLEKHYQEIGFIHNHNVIQRLRRLANRALLEKGELAVLQGMLSANQRLAKLLASKEEK